MRGAYIAQINRLIEKPAVAAACAGPARWHGRQRRAGLLNITRMPACKLAAAMLRERLRAVAGQILEADASDIELTDGRAFVRGTDLGVEMRQLARAAYHQSHHFPAVVETGLSAVATYDPYGTFSNACHIAIVAVDIPTGQVTIERFVVVEDAGRLINPMIVEGQIHGGVAQGIANALYEKVIYDDRGNVLTGSLAEYPVPTTAEIPTIEIHHLETLAEASITGAKGSARAARSARQRRHSTRFPMRWHRLASVSLKCRSRRSGYRSCCARRGSKPNEPGRTPLLR